MMQDDFGDFLQAAPASGQTARPPQHKQTNQRKDLSTKIMESLDLSGSNQKAALNFKPVARQTARRPQMGHSVPSSKSADWSHLNVETSDFMAPLKQKSRGRIMAPQPSYTMQNLHDPNPHASYPQGPAASYGAAYVPQNPSFGQNTSFGQTVNHMPIGAQNQFIQKSSSGNFANVSAVIATPSAVEYGSQVRPALQNQFVPSLQQGFNISPLQMLPTFHKTDQLQQQEPQLHRSQRQRSSDVALPSWMTNPNEIPTLYKEVLKICATPSSFADTSRLYPILVSSELPKDVLGHIWSAANQSTPGQLTFSEVYIALALVAIAQSGGLNLSVRYVTSLPKPPIPNIHLGIAKSQNVTSGLNPAFSTPMPRESDVLSSVSIDNKTRALSDDFTEFQSVVTPQADFDDFQEFKSNPNPQQISNGLVALSKPTLPSSMPVTLFDTFSAPQTSQVADQSYPDRSMINSPKAQPWYGPVTTNSVGVMPPEYSTITKTDDKSFLQDNISQLTKSSSTHSLPITSASPNLNVNVLHAASSSSRLSDPVDDDFGEFKTNVSVSQSTAIPKLSLPGFNPTSANKDASAKGIMSTQQKSDLMNVDIGYDKYSAFRDLVPLDNNAASNDDGFSDYSDFQSVSAPGPVAADLLDVDTGTNSVWPAAVLGSATFSQWNPAKDSVNDSPSNFGKSVLSGVDKFAQDDSGSVNSLELPSLSKTILNLSIGISSPLPSQMAEPEEAYDVFRSDPPTILPAGANDTDYNPGERWHSRIEPISTHVATNDDDQLYSLDEPMSPPKQHNKSRAIDFSTAPKPLSPPKKFVVPRNISDADSDFGDFSSAPPPMDDMADHDSPEFDPYQVGNSSLVDFDAYGHFQEAKQETKKREKVNKPKKEESTAFSEFMKSTTETENVFNGSSTHEPNVIKNQTDWSGFKSSISADDAIENSMRESISQMKIQAVQEREKISHNAVGTDGGVEEHLATLSPVSAVVPDVQDLNEENPVRSKWDIEGEQFKARMEGNNASDSTELYVEHWGRCLATCKDIIVSTGEIFAALNSPAVCHEIVNSGRGKEFISCTSEVYGVARRIRKGIEIIGVSEEDLSQTLKDIEIAWNNVLGFCPYTPSVHKTPEHCVKSASDGTAGSSPVDNMACSLCLLSTVGDSPVGVEYGGRSYHAPCANLWLNQVAPILPRLELLTVK